MNTLVHSLKLCLGFPSAEAAAAAQTFAKQQIAVPGGTSDMPLAAAHYTSPLQAAATPTNFQHL